MLYRITLIDGRGNWHQLGPLEFSRAEEHLEACMRLGWFSSVIPYKEEAK